ncbi:MAG: L-threonylcarbamoyladenylate synthase [Acidimicrobiales bacterium]
MSLGRGEEEQLVAAVSAVRAGVVIGLPTETVYGIGVDPGREDATRRIFAVKQRPETLALPLLVSQPDDAGAFAELDQRALFLIEAYWPGPLTLVLRRRRGPALHLGGDSLTVGIRCPDQPVARELLARSGALAVTSANRHGEAPAHTAAELRASLGDAVGVIVDGGRCDGAVSTVVSLLGRDAVVLREGAIPGSALFL